MTITYFAFYEYKIDGRHYATETILDADIAMNSDGYMEWKNKRIDEIKPDEGTFIVKCFSRL